MSHFACLDYVHCLLIQFSDLMHYEILEVWLFFNHSRLDTRIDEALLNEQQKVDGFIFVLEILQYCKLLSNLIEK